MTNSIFHCLNDYDFWLVLAGPNDEVDKDLISYNNHCCMFVITQSLISFTVQTGKLVKVLIPI